MKNAEPILRVRDLHKGFKGVAAVEGVSFDVAAGISALLAHGSQCERSDRLLGRPAA